jgi:multicomponent Na+:H+ antiporter subunit B
MTSPVLVDATRFLVPAMLGLALFLLIRGHDEPGGGFVAGLMVAAAFALLGLARGDRALRSAMRISPQSLVGVGLLLAVSSGVISLLFGLPFMTGLKLWGSSMLSTVLLFDVGVCLLVAGMVLLIVLTLAEESR